MKGRIILSAPAHPASQMALDEALFSVRKTDYAVTIRFYEWICPCFTFGYFCRIPSSLKEKIRSAPGETMVRRLTGGHWVPHGSDMTFSMILDQEKLRDPWPLSRNYARIHRALAKAFADFGISSSLHSEREPGAVASPCFTYPSAGDLLVQNKKVAGGAQRRRRGRILHQGTIMLKKPSLYREFHLDSDCSFLKGIVENASCLDDVRDKIPSGKELIRSFVRALEQDLLIPFDERPLTDSETDAHTRLISERYGRAEWSLGER